MAALSEFGHIPDVKMWIPDVHHIFLFKSLS
jgi:hypothetical protein